MLYLQNSLTGLVAEPVKSAVKANISVEANQFCLHCLFSKKILYFEVLKNNLLFTKYTNKSLVRGILIDES